MKQLTISQVLQMGGTTHAVCDTWHNSEVLQEGQYQSVLEGTETEARFEESESPMSNISNECENNDEDFWESMTRKIFAPCCCFV
jgi:hypothetical protein